FCERIVGAARLSFEIGALLNGKALVVDVAFDARWPLKRNAQTFDRSDQAAAHNNLLGLDLAPHLRLVAEQKRLAVDVALNLAVDLDLAFRGDVAGDRQVLADNRRDHLAPTRAGTFGSESCWQGRLRIANPFNQFSHTPAPPGLCREHHGYLLITNLRRSALELTGAGYATLTPTKPLSGIVAELPSRPDTPALLPKTISPRLGLLNIPVGHYPLDSRK